ncbi:hypothetical protein SAMN05421505_11682 [Sinosporangium album]|uniref:Small secreted domain n=1 Tax=Sinosporangium album TaxID=504805 RepID=A0A1G8CN69_9ACTN|nr:hypothetical protein [Sinosporangium album]SDH47027.1 hypothetical protein SAMN05421505_11682 [Sinosporangium album]
MIRRILTGSAIVGLALFGPAAVATANADTIGSTCSSNNLIGIANCVNLGILGSPIQSVYGGHHHHLGGHLGGLHGLW